MKTWFTINNLSDSQGEYDEITMFDEIGAFGITAKDFADKFKSIPQNRRITVGINSPGGSVFDGLTIYNLLNQRRNMVTTRVDGLAASIASVIAMAGSRVVMPENAMMMIHDPTGVVIGDSDDMKKMSDTLDKIRDQIAGVYKSKTGKDMDDIKKAMSDETWFTANEAKEFGLCDEVNSPVCINNTFDLRLFRNAPGVAVAKNNTTGTIPNKKNTKMEKLMTALVEAKLIPSSKLEDGEAAELFKATFKELKEARDNLQTEIENLRKEQEKQTRKMAEAFVNEAVKSKKIKDDAALKTRWVNAMIADEEGTREMLNSMEVASPRTGSPPAPIEDDAITGETKIRELQDKLKTNLGKLSSKNPEERDAAIAERSLIARQIRELRGDKEMFTAKKN